MHALAAAYAALGRYPEALALNEQTLALRRAKLGPIHVDTLRSQMNVAGGLLQAGRYAEAVAPARDSAERWEKQTGTDAANLYNAARCRALAAAAIRASDRSRAGAKNADDEEDKAVARLRQAVSAGWDDRAVLAADQSLDGLRDRDDFKELVARVGGATKQ
jgi:Tetratricopeptide repeat